MKRLFKNRINQIILAVMLVCSCVVVFNIVRVALVSNGEGEVETNKKSGLKANGLYDLPNNPTQLQKELYNELTEKTEGYILKESDLENDQETIDICTTVAKNFVADFYTWSNKKSIYDIGGIEFTYDNSDEIYNSARDLYYCDLDAYVAKYGRNNLPAVNSVAGETVYGGTFKLFSETVPCFYTEIKWTYGDETTVDISGFPTHASFISVWDVKNECWRVAKIGHIE